MTMNATELKKIRDQLGMNNSELATTVGIHRSTIQKYINGNRRITEEFAKKIRTLANKNKPALKSAIKQLEEIATNIIPDELKPKVEKQSTTIVRTKFCTPLNNMCHANDALTRARAELGSIENSKYTDELATLDDIIAQLQKVRSSVRAKQREVLKYIEGV